MCKIIGSCSRILFGQRTKKEKEREGLKETRNKIKEKEIVVSKTDKSGLLCADSISNYKEAEKVHTKDDKSVDWKTVQKIESNMNEHLKAFNRMLDLTNMVTHKKIGLIKPQSQQMFLLPPCIF